MSTITKIDRRVRTLRAARRDTVRALQRAIGLMRLMQPPPLMRLAAAGVFGDVLHSVIANPRMTGARKATVFARFIKQLEESNASSTAQPSVG